MHAYQERAVANEPEFIRKKAYETCEREAIEKTNEFKKQEIENIKKSEVKVKPLQEPVGKARKNPEKPLTRNI